MTLKLKVRTKLPAKLIAGPAIRIDKSGLGYTVSCDITQINSIASFDPLAKEVLIFDTTTGAFATVTLASIINGGAVRRVITKPGDVNIGMSDGLIILAKTVAEDTNFNLPGDALKVGPVKIVDWNGIANTRVLKVIPNGAETINGQPFWTIAGQYGSAVFSPTGAGLGYAV